MTVRAFAADTVDPVILERSSMIRIRTFLDERYNTEQDAQQVIYDYPKPVQSSILLRLIGNGDLMDDDEQYLFLKAFEEGFRPILEDAYYEWVDVLIRGQVTGNSNPDQNPNDLPETQYLFNRVVILLRAQCSGDACTDDNFENFALQEMEAWAQTFLSYLYSVGPPTAEMYFDDLLQIDVGEHRAVDPLIPAANIDTSNPDPDEAKISGVIWVIVIIFLGILVCACAWVGLRYPARRNAAQQGQVKDVKEGNDASGMQPEQADESSEA
jgi:hypothetical protein